MKTLIIHCDRFAASSIFGGLLELTLHGVNTREILNAIDDEAAVEMWLAERREVKAEDERVVKGLNK
jgi:hypothetical protein